MSQTLPVGSYQSLNPGCECPVGDDDPVRMENSVFGDVTGYDVAPEDGGVMRVRVLAPLTLRHRLPVVVEHVLVCPDLHDGKIAEKKLKTVF